MLTIVVLIWQHLPDSDRIVILAVILTLVVTTIGEDIFAPLFKAE